MTVIHDMTSSDLRDRIKRAVRDVPDFPKPGIMFKDITPLLAESALFRETTIAMADTFSGEGITHIVAIESRGFILGAPVAQRLDAGFVPVRKAGKLPAKVVAEEYSLEYGTDILEMHADACDWAQKPKVLIVDDVLATGGTADAARRLLEGVGAEVVGFSFLIALAFLPGLAKLRGRPVRALITY